MNNPAVYLSEYLDETVPATDLNGWAKWVQANEEDDGPQKIIPDGHVFAVTVADITWHECTRTDGSMVVPEGVDWSADIIAVAEDDGDGWTPDDFVSDAGSLEQWANFAHMADGDTLWLAIGVFRTGPLTATYRVIDGEPFLQPDGWTL